MQIPFEIQQQVLVDVVEVDPAAAGELLESHQRRIVFVRRTLRTLLDQLRDLMLEKGVHVAVVVSPAVSRSNIVDGEGFSVPFEFGEDARDLLPLFLQKGVDIPDMRHVRLALVDGDRLAFPEIEFLRQQAVRREEHAAASFEYELNDERIASVGAAGANVEHRLDTHVQSFFRIVSYVHNAFF